MWYNGQNAARVRAAPPLRRSGAPRGAHGGKVLRVPIYVAPTVSALTEFCARLPVEQKTVIFCEDRLTLEVESALAARHGVLFGTSVTTFARFIGRAGGRRALSNQGSVMVVGSVAAQLAGQLRCFGKNPAGSASRLYETIAQLRAALVTPDMLDEARRGADAHLSEKLADIALVYRGYLDFLAQGYLDESGVLALLPAAIEGGALDGARVVFAGFASFTRQAAEGIRAALAAADSVTGVFLGGEADLYTNEGADAFERYCRAAGADCERFTLPSGLCPAAEALRQSLSDPSARPPQAADNVFLYEAEDGDDELSCIAAMIRREAFRGVRFNEMAVFLSDVKDYSVRLGRIFGEYRIPYFSDAKKSLAAHPLARFVMKWFAALAEGFEPADVDALIGNPFFGADRASADALRNYLLRYANYRGGLRRPVKAEVFGGKGRGMEGSPLVLEGLRARLCSAFDGVSARMAGGAYCRAVRRLLESFGCERRQKEIAAALEGEGLRAESSYFSRGMESILRVLGEAEELLGGRVLRAEEFAALLGESLTALEISLIPQYLDAVYVGDISESKRRTAKVVFAARLTDAVPPAGADTALISDRDIDRLRALRVEISPKIREVNARARENAGLALCSFSERLYLSWPLSAGGQPQRRSELVAAVRGRLCTPRGEELPVLGRARLERMEREDAAAYLRYLSCLACEKEPAVRVLLRRADEYRRGRAGFGACAGLLAALTERGDAPEKLLYAPRRPAVFEPAAAAVLLHGKNTVSPTLIEGYFNCPYRNFAERGLLLAEREEASVRAVDTGDLMHELLRSMALCAADIPDLSACAAFARRRAEELLSAPPYSYLRDTARGGYAADVLLRDAQIVCCAAFEQIAGSDFAVAGAEQPFGYPGSPLRGVRLSAGGREIYLAGKIDRVDTCGELTRVVDYKTGRFDASASAYYTGRRLQLPLYLSAAAQGRRAAGAYYFPARVGFRSDPDEPPFRMQGFTDADDEVVRRSDKFVAEGEKSRFIDAAYRARKTGPAGADFSDFLRYSVLAAEACARETEEGCIAASPCEGACAYCPYGGVCGHSPEDGARKEEKISAEEIVRIVRRERGDV